MPIEHKMRRVDRPDDPKRCQAVVTNGQCPYVQIENALYCQMHGGAAIQKKADEHSARLYRLAKWQDRVGEFADHEKVKSLREEIGILRVLLEETIGMCKDQEQLFLYSNKISELVVKIEKLVASCHRLEASTGMLLDKSAALQLAGVIVEIIGRYVTDPDSVDAISNEIIVAIAQQGK